MKCKQMRNNIITWKQRWTQELCRSDTFLQDLITEWPELHAPHVRMGGQAPAPWARTPANRCGKTDRHHRATGSRIKVKRNCLSSVWPAGASEAPSVTEAIRTAALIKKPRTSFSDDHFWITALPVLTLSVQSCGSGSHNLPPPISSGIQR